MNRFSRVLVPVILLVGLSVAPARAQEEKPFQVALVNPIQIYGEDEAILIFRLNVLYGKNTWVKGLDVGLVNHTTAGTSKGVQWGLAGYNEADFVGWQNNLVNLTEGAFQGYQLGAFNLVGGGEGVQAGAVNVSEAKFSGLQFSLVNIADDLYGIQIGLVNIIKSKETLSFLPIVNWKF